ncbi:uncharacterized protein LOC135347884 [Halichondria panicea]|uniref:uncharacterized protein LOC135347884 n=1 Tax=Halichondria panicea TaxID=6063 RepID=UPI00312B8145
MYGTGSTPDCQLGYTDPAHMCGRDCSKEHSRSKRSVSFNSKSRSPTSSSRSGSLSPIDSVEQRLLPLSVVNSSSRRLLMASNDRELENSGQSWGSRTTASSYTTPIGDINSDYHGFVGDEDPTFSIISRDHTAMAIRKCERYILRPYKTCLRMIGWIPFRQSTAGRVGQVLLVTLWTLAILAAMVTQILSCFRRDVFVPEVNLGPASTINTTVEPTPTKHPPIRCSDNIISALILPDIVLLLAYFFGVYLFSKGETEYLSRLASHVFIKNSESGNVSYNTRLIRILIVFFIAALVWLFMSLVIRIISAMAGNLFDPSLVVMWPPDVTIKGGIRMFLVIFSLFGFFTFDLVYLFSVLNYAAQAEMNVYLIWDIARLIKENKYEHVDAAIKDIYESKRYLKVLSRRTATLTGLVLFDLFSLAVVGLIDLEAVNERTAFPRDENLRILSSVAAGLNCISWLVLVIVPFVQAARVTHACERLKDMGPEVRARPYVYETTPLLDMDSLVSYLQTTRLRAYIFGVSIHPWMAYAVLLTFTFTLCVLFQVGTFERLSPYI